MTREKPTILLVHGAWHHPAYYKPLIDALKSRNFEAHCPRLPSCTANGEMETSPASSFPEDVALIRSTVADLVGSGKEVIAVLHSYGGIVGTEALHGLSLDEMTGAGQRGGVKRMVYMAAFVPRKGQSLAGIFGGRLPPFIDVKVCDIGQHSLVSIYYSPSPLMLRLLSV